MISHDPSFAYALYDCHHLPAGGAKEKRPTERVMYSIRAYILHTDTQYMRPNDNGRVEKHHHHTKRESVSKTKTNGAAAQIE